MSTSIDTIVTHRRGKLQSSSVLEKKPSIPPQLSFFSASLLLSFFFLGGGGGGRESAIKTDKIHGPRSSEALNIDGCTCGRSRPSSSVFPR